MTGRRAVAALAAGLMVFMAACSASRSPVVTPPADSLTSASSPSGSAAATPRTSPEPSGPAQSTPTEAMPVLPDPVFTPGMANPQVSQATLRQTICGSGWTESVRPPEAYTEQVKRLEAGGGGTVTYAGTTYQVHGFDLSDRTLGHYELDHLIPLELGGAPADPHNLWLEPDESPEGDVAPGTGSQTKDRVENAAREAVCSGHLALADARRRIASNWYRLGEDLGVIAHH